MSIHKKPAATQHKIPINPIGMCKVDANHGFIAQGRKDKLCENCGKFADKAAKKRRSA
jgi:hypothetical protein